MNAMIREPEELRRYYDYTGQEVISPITTNVHYPKYIENMLGTALIFCDYETEQRILASPELEEMDAYPGENSIRMIDGVLVVKLKSLS